MYAAAPLSKRQKLSRELRALWGTLAAIFVLGAGVAYGATWYTQGELEREATKDARKLSIEVLRPMLVPSDAASPIRGERYEQLLGFVDERVMAGPINRVRLWRPDGTIVFADDPTVVGRRDPGMRDDIHAVIAGTSESVVQGDRFRTLTLVRLGEPPVLVAVELARSHSAIVERARDRWYPWAIRAGVAAGVCVVLYIVTVIAFGLFGALKGRVKPTTHKEPAQPGRKTVQGHAAAKAKEADLPPYMMPGFQEQVLARQRAEDSLEALERERNDLRQRVRRLESELEEAKRGLPEKERSAPAMRRN
ncbi:MAG: hypothetical protein ACRDGW_03175 [Actinomycetota bacterium]